MYCKKYTSVRYPVNIKKIKWVCADCYVPLWEKFVKPFLKDAK